MLSVDVQVSSTSSFQILWFLSGCVPGIEENVHTRSLVGVFVSSPTLDQDPLLVFC